MEPIQGVDLKNATTQAQNALAKIATARVVDYIRGLMVSSHNLKMKSARLLNESAQAKVAADEIERQIKDITEGKWDSIHPIELADKPA